MDGLGNLLKNKHFGEPDEFAKLKEYIKCNYQAEAKVSLKDGQIIVGLPSAALATKLRYDQAGLQAAAKTERPIIIRIAWRS